MREVDVCADNYPKNVFLMCLDASVINGEWMLKRLRVMCSAGCIFDVVGRECN